VRDDALKRQLALVRRHALALLGALFSVAWLLAVRGWDALVDAAGNARALGPRESARRAGWLIARACGFVVVSLAAFVIVGAFVAARVPGFFARAFIVTLFVLVLPLALRHFVRARLRCGVATGCNALVVATLLIVNGGEAGAVLRRHGDWFLGWRGDASALSTRARIVAAGCLLEHFAAPLQMLSHERSPDEAPPFYGPWRPNEAPYPPDPTWVHWYHPLGGATRALPLFESRRFGAARPQPRPGECELGHCGVDLAAPLGAPVFAIADGVVERVERDADAGGRAGRYVRLGHLEGTWVTRYIHLSTIRSDLRPGVRVAAGELIGAVGRTGVDENFPHLHFGLSRRTGASGELYVDPEPLLRVWELR
jgi:hypothetical protein